MDQNNTSFLQYWKNQTNTDYNNYFVRTVTQGYSTFILHHPENPKFQEHDPQADDP